LRFGGGSWLLHGAGYTNIGTGSTLTTLYFMGGAFETTIETSTVKKYYREASRGEKGLIMVAEIIRLDPHRPSATSPKSLIKIFCGCDVWIANNELSDLIHCIGFGGRSWLLHGAGKYYYRNG
jgi:hypothetical protein